MSREDDGDRDDDGDTASPHPHYRSRAGHSRLHEMTRGGREMANARNRHADGDDVGVTLVMRHSCHVGMMKRGGVMKGGVMSSEVDGRSMMKPW
jgi:hypothetical protein